MVYLGIPNPSGSAPGDPLSTHDNRRRAAGYSGAGLHEKHPTAPPRGGMTCGPESPRRVHRSWLRRLPRAR